MVQFFRVGEEVNFKCIPDIRLIIEEINETSGSIKCRYYDDNLRKYIRLRLSADSLVPGSRASGKGKLPLNR